MSERTQSNTVMKALRHAGLDPVRVENPAHPGTPDINYIGGWIELKWLRNWPKLGGIVKIDHFTQQQRVWLRRRFEKGGRSCLLLKVSDEWLLFDGLTAALHVGRVNRQGLYDHCLIRWTKGLDTKELVNCLRS